MLDIPDEGKIIGNTEVISHDSLALFKFKVALHSFELMSNLAPPSEGGSLVFMYREAQEHEGGEARINLMEQFLKASGFKVNVEGFNITAVMDNNFSLNIFITFHGVDH